jgi:hypothetical protein
MTALNIQFLDDALADIKAGQEFYDVQEMGIGSYFLESIFSDIESLRLYAGIHERHFKCYRLLSKRFPYSIYYQMSEANVYILAVLPMKLDPKAIFKRLSEV